MRTETRREWVRSGSAPGLSGMEYAWARFVSHRFPLHAHDTWVIGAIIDGAKSSRHGRRLLTAGRGELMLFNPYEEHSSFGHGEPWTWVGIYPGRELMQAWFGEARFTSPLLRSPALARRIVALHRTLASDEPALAGQELLAQAVAPLLSLPASSAHEAGAPVRRVRELLDADLERDLGLDELARAAGLQPLTLLRSFRKAVGCTPHTYRTARRLAAAKDALKRGEAPAQVAAGLGFCDQSHLTRVFRRWTGSTPSAFAAAHL